MLNGASEANHLLETIAGILFRGFWMTLFFLLFWVSLFVMGRRQEVQAARPVPRVRQA